MSTITKEGLEPVIERLEHYATNVKWTNVQAAQDMLIAVDAMRIALASLEAEPVAWRVVFKLDGQPGSDFEKTFENQAKMNEIISLHERAGFFASITPLYTAPPVPVSVPTFEEWCEQTEQKPVGWVRDAMKEAYEGCRASMLHGAERVSNRDELLTVCAEAYQVVGAMAEALVIFDSTEVQKVMDNLSQQKLVHADVLPFAVPGGNSPVIPDGLRLALSNAGIAAPESDEMLAATCDKYIQALVIWVKERKPFRSAVIQDGWVACGERMPEVGVKVLCFPVNDEPIHATYNGQVWLQDISWSVSDEPIDNVISCNVFHWMPLPATPQQEVK